MTLSRTGLFAAIILAAFMLLGIVLLLVGA